MTTLTVPPLDVSVVIASIAAEAQHLRELAKTNRCAPQSREYLMQALAIEHALKAATAPRTD